MAEQEGRGDVHLDSDIVEELRDLKKALEWRAQRITRLEEAERNTAQDISEIKTILANLEAIANMGRGALWLALRIGGMLGIVAAIVEAIRILTKWG